MPIPSQPTRTETAEKPKPRAPRVGDHVRYRPWRASGEDQSWHAVVARVMGMATNLAILSHTGQWLSEGPVPYDETGTLAGHWSWTPKA